MKEATARRRARRGHRRVVAYPSALPYVRLRCEARKRRVDVSELLARLLEVLYKEDLYRAVLDD